MFHRCEFSTFYGFLLFLFCLFHFVLGNSRYQNDFTAEEKDAIKQFRLIGGSAIGNDSFRNSDEYIIRFLKTSSMDVKVANQKMLKYLEFRKLNKLDEILSEEMRDMRRWCNFTVDGHDIEWRPILFWPFGNCDLRRIILSGKNARLSRYLQYLIETVGVTVRNSKTKDGRQVVQAVGIMDLNGFSLRQQACLGCLPFYSYLIQTLDTNYPHALKSFSIINTPKVFHNVLSRVITVAAPTTKEIVHVYGLNKGEWKHELLKTIRSDQLPQILGGASKTQEQPS